MEFLTAILLLLAFGIFRQRQARLILNIEKKFPNAKNIVTYSHALRMLQSGGTWFGAFSLAYYSFFVLNAGKQQISASPETTNTLIAIIFILSGLFGSLAEYALMRIIEAVPGIEFDVTRYRKEIILAQIIKWLLVASLLYCWITIVSITFTRVE